MSASTKDNFKWLFPEGEMAARIRNYDWENSSLGPSNSWPVSLKTTINLCLQSRFPMYIWWGPELINIYNDAYIKLTGTNKHPQFLGRPAREMWQEIWESTLYPMLEAVVKKGETFLYKNLLIPTERQGVKEEAYFTFTYGPAFDDVGKIVGVTCICHERTSEVFSTRERDQAIRELELARDDLQNVFRQSPFITAILSGPEYSFTLASKAYEDFIGRSVAGKTVREIFKPEEISLFLPILDNVRKTGESFVGKAMPFNPVVNGKVENRYIDLGNYPVKGASGNVEGVLVIASDVTEEVMAKQAIADLNKKLSKTVHDLEIERDMRDRFVASLTHDLRTPITTAKLSAQLLSKKFTDEFLHQILNRISKNMDRADRMIQNLLDANSIKAGQEIPLKRSPCQLSTIISEVLEDLSVGQGDRFIFNSSDISGNWDRDALKRIFENLITNAIKYGLPGGTITIDLLEENNLARIKVHNEGNPISTVEREKLFKLFNRSASAIAGNQKGWGLGLTLVKGLVQAHGGEVEVDSSEEKGTTFTVIIPKVVANEN